MKHFEIQNVFTTIILCSTGAFLTTKNPLKSDQNFTKPYTIESILGGL